MPENTLQIYLDKIHFDNRARMFMWVYTITFAQPNVDGDVQMYMSRKPFKIKRINTAGDDLVHHWDGDGALVASLPTAGLESVRLTTYLIQDKSKVRDAGKLLHESFGNDAAGTALAAALGSALSALPGPAGIATGAVFKVTPALASFIGKALMKVKDRVRIYGEGTVIFDEPSDFEDSVRRWSINKSDTGYFTTSWDFLNTQNPAARLKTLTLPDELKARFNMV